MAQPPARARRHSARQSLATPHPRAHRLGDRGPEPFGRHIPAWCKRPDLGIGRRSAVGHLEQPRDIDPALPGELRIGRLHLRDPGIESAASAADHAGHRVTVAIGNDALRETRKALSPSHAITAPDRVRTGERQGGRARHTSRTGYCLPPHTAPAPAPAPARAHFRRSLSARGRAKRREQPENGSWLPSPITNRLRHCSLYVLIWQ